MVSEAGSHRASVCIIKFLEAVGDRLFDGLVTADPATADLHPAYAWAPQGGVLNVAPTRHFPVDGPPLAQREYDIGIVAR